MRAALATEEASAANLKAARLAVAGETARQYIQLRGAEARTDNTVANVTLLRDTLQVVRWRRDAGLATATDETRALQQLEQAEAGLPDRLYERRAALNQLATLSGEAPGALDGALSPTGAIPTAEIVFGAQPADILRRRPDVIAAERELAAEVERIGVQRSALYPSLSLSGSLSGSASNADRLFDDLFSQLAVSLSQLLFDGGRARADVDAQRAAADAALAAYAGAILEALEDVDNAFAEFRAAEAAFERRAAARASAVSAVEDLRSQYQSGLVDLSSLLDAQQTLISASDAAIQAEARRTRALVTVIQALGGDARPIEGETE